jgi:ParB family chromosome partitioning protein
MPKKLPSLTEKLSGAIQATEQAQKIADLQAEILALRQSPSGVTQLPLSEIITNPNQPRRYFDSHKIVELSESIRQFGILEPLLVRPIEGLQKYEIVFGERRYQGAKIACLQEVPVIIKDLSDADALSIALVENLQRENLNPLEETEAILQLLCLELNQPNITEIKSLLYQMNNSKDFNDNVIISNLPQQWQAIIAIFQGIGKMSWESFVVNRLPLLNLPEDIKSVLLEGKLEYTKAKTIASLKNPEQRKIVLEEAITANLSLSQIKQKIKELTVKTDQLITPEQKIKDTMLRLTKSRFWEDPKKKKKIERLLEQMESLLAEE